MHRQDLLSALRHAGVPQGYVWIEDVHEPDPIAPDFVFLRRVDDSWQTGVFERGVWQVVAAFSDESAACAHFLHQLAAPGTAPQD
ncbi:hypothetical protein [Streptomyces sp. H27-D2]|uniref:hypothetical protein n=1 Tax=Streptomyces sp. H27-D2 TaxID=3046304 RepID=UPI002DB76503|nr:hypothetical protein [Streptomyces sp. H27-D2]MEC4018648.1 hypothetical protein [Streptomyces sp. H27-D2]